MTILPITQGQMRDELYMREALREALSASARGEVPVGAILVLDGRIVGRGFNRPIGANDPTAHAEIVAIRDAALRMDNYRLTGAELFVTLEPCLMCLGAAVHARVGRIVFGARDPRVGASSCFNLFQSSPGTLNHQVTIEGGVREEESAATLRSFFAGRRLVRSGGRHQKPRVSAR